MSKKTDLKSKLYNFYHSQVIAKARKAPSMTRIIGGVTAALGTVPWQASLAVKGNMLSSFDKKQKNTP